MSRIDKYQLKKAQELDLAQEPSRSALESKRNELKEFELSHWNIPNLKDYLDIYGPTYRGFFLKNENIPSILLDTIRNPDYLYFPAKEFLNIELLPIQCVILREMWVRPFPMIVATRGFGKLLREHELIRVKNGWKTMAEIKVGDLVYGGDGRLTKVVAKSDKQYVKMYRLTLRDGRTIEACEDHTWKVWDKYANQVKGRVTWSIKNTKDMVGTYSINRIGKKSSGKEYRYALPLNNKLLEEAESSLDVHPYIIGVLLGDGGITHKNTVITSLDPFIIDKVRTLLPDKYTIKQDNEKIYRIVRIDKTVPPFYKILEKIGIQGLGSHNKYIPDLYQYASNDQKMELLRGLMDTDGYAKKSVVEYSTISPQLAQDFLNVARSLGIHCRHAIYPAYYNNKRCNDCHRINLYTKEPIFSLPRKLNGYVNHKISKQGASKYEKVFVTNIDEIGYDFGYCIQVDNIDHTYLTKDYLVTHNSFLLAVYGVLRCLLYSNVRVVVVGAAFRQAKLVFEYAERIWMNSPLLRNMCGTGKDQGMHRNSDKLDLRIGQNTFTAVPLGDGCLVGNTAVTFGDHFGYISEHNTSAQITETNTTIYGNGQFRFTDEAYTNGYRPTKIILTKKGYTFEATYNHKMRVLRNNEFIFVRTDEMVVGDKILLDRSKRWHSGNFQCSLNDAYFLGMMIGDGCWTNKYKLSFATKDNQHFEQYLDKWTKCADNIHYVKYGFDCRREWLDFWGLDRAYSHQKLLPHNILAANKDNMTACLQGLFDTDGHISTSTAKGGVSILVGYTTTSSTLVYQLQYILLHYGIICYIKKRFRNKKWNIVYDLLITGKNVKIFTSEIGFRLPRKQQKLLYALKMQHRNVASLDYVPGIINNMATIATQHRVKRKNGSKVDNTISSSKLLTYSDATFDIVDKFLLKYGHVQSNDMDIIRKLNNKDIYYDDIVSISNSQNLTFDIHVPDGHEYCANGFFSHNSKIRGLRATEIICDEMSSVPVEIYENVVAGFAAVTANPILNVKVEARKKFKEAKGTWTLKDREVYDSRPINKAMISGTAYFTFNHFYEYWTRYCAIVKSKGNKEKLENIFKGNVPDGFNWRDYSVIRIPYDMCPPGFMEQTHIARSKATVHHGIFNVEYGAVFAKDTNGFFKRTLIESCMVKPNGNIIIDGSGVMFRASTSGSSSSKYVYAVDPASESDNFCIIIIEVLPTHRRIVYCWTTNRQKHREIISRDKNADTVIEKDFYAFCARKIRKLMRKFPCAKIALDKQGGGVAVEEALHNTVMLQPGEVPIWPVIDDEKPKPTDLEQGLHILEIISFSSADWVAEANHSLKKDFEDKALLFPFYDPLVLMEAVNNDSSYDGDVLEDCIYEIEELKDELTCIQHTQTPSGRDKWDTPEVKLPGNRKGRQRKDRYTALLMANMVARNLNKSHPVIQNVATGGFAHAMSNTEKFQPVSTKAYTGPEWFEKAAMDAYF